MNIVIMTTQLLLGLAILVFVHETGHFVAARIFKVRVPKFYLFFNPKFSILKFKRINGKWKFKVFSANLPDTELVRDANGAPVLDEKGKNKYKMIDTQTLDDDDWRKYPENTEYGIGWLPLGGYCQIAGMIDETQTVENLSTEPQSWEFRSKPAWQRLLIVLAGVIVNMIVGVLLFAMVIRCYEKQYVPTSEITEGLYAFESAKNIGFATGDKIVSIDGKTYERYNDVKPALILGNMAQVERDGKLMDIVLGDRIYDTMKVHMNTFLEPLNFPFVVDSVVNPDLAAGKLQKGDKLIRLNDIQIECYGTWQEYHLNFANQNIALTYLRDNDTLTTTAALDSNGLLGIFCVMPNYKLATYSVGQSFIYGWKDAMNNLRLNISGLGKLLSGQEKASSLSGPIGIAQIYGNIWNWGRFWYITGLLSVILAFMNVLPIPGLDGGHAIFTLIELLTGRKVSDNVIQAAQTVGMIILLLLMIFVFGNDIFKLFH